MVLWNGMNETNVQYKIKHQTVNANERASVMSE